MRLFVRILAGVAIALVLMLGIVAVVIATIDTRTLVAPIAAQVKKATGREITVGGDARIGLSLTPTLELSDVALANASWGTAKDMIRAKRVEAQVALIPLLSRRVDIVRFTLVEPVILLETDAQGRGNWVFGTPAAPSKPSDPVGDAAGAFGLGEFAVEKGQLTWRNGRTGESTAVRIDKLYLRARDPAKPVVAQFEGRVGEIPLALEGHFGPLAALKARQWPWPLSVKGDVAGRKVEAQAKLRETPEGLEASDFDYASGSSRLRGKVLYAARPARPYVRFDLAGDSVRLRDLDLAGAGVAAAAGVARSGTTPKPDARVFPATPLALAGLRAVDADGSIVVGKLELDDGRTLSDVRARLQLADGRLDLPEWRAATFGGTAQGRLLVDARSDRAAALSLRLEGRGFDLPALLAAAGVKRDMQGGKTDVDVDVNARGASPRDLASTLSGIVTVKVGPARYVSSTAGLPAAVGQAVVSLNPLASKSSSTELQCAVVRLPFNGGVARVDRTIAVETDQVGVTASGTIDLRNERLDLAMTPRVKGANIADLGKLAAAVRLQGRLDAPQVVVDPIGSIAAAIDIAQLARGGRAALAGMLQPAPSGPGECAVALGARPATTPQAPAAQQQRPAPPVDAAQELNRALGRLLKR
jgi:uncharacterized protein involved in outer membrane biogenesis